MRRITPLALALAFLPTIALADDTPPLLEPVASFGSAIEGDWLYVYGGHRGETHAHSRDNLSPAFSRLNLLDRKTWELLPPGPPLQGLPLVGHAGRVIRVGGLSARNAAGAEEDLHSLPEVAAYDPLARTWTALPALPEGRSSHDAVVASDTCYVVGGWTLSGATSGATWLATAWSLDLASVSTATWTRLPDPPFKRRALALVAAGGKLHALGGMGDDERPSRATFTFDLAKKEWAKGPDLPIGGFGISAHARGDAVHVSGHEGDVHRLQAGTWEKLGTLGLPRLFHRVFAVSEREVLVLGGAAKGGHLTSVESLDLAATGPRVTSFTVPFPGASKNRQGIFLHDNALWVFGGNRSLKQHDFKPENFLDEAWRVHLGTLQVSKLPPFPVKRESMAADAFGGEGIVLGGFGVGENGTRSFADVFRFHFGKRAWTKAEVSLPEPRTQGALLVRKGRAYVFGGMDYDQARQQDAFRLPLDVLVWRPDGRDSTFEPSGAKLTGPRRAFGGALLDDKAYLVGGMKTDFELVRDAQAFDFEKSAWEELPAPRPRISPQLVALGGRLYLAGGSSPQASGKDLESNPSLEVYDPKTRAWTTLIEKLPISPRHLRMFAWRDRLLLTSTQAEDGSILRLVVIEPGTNASVRKDAKDG